MKVIGWSKKFVDVDSAPVLEVVHVVETSSSSKFYDFQMKFIAQPTLSFV